MAAYLPFSKLRPGQYLIGTKERQLHIEGLDCLVETDGDFMHLKEYLKCYSMEEGVGFKRLLRKGITI